MICIRIREPGAGDQQQRPEICSHRQQDPEPGNREQLQRDPLPGEICSQGGRDPEPGAGRSAAGVISCSHRRGIRASEQPEGETDG